MLVLPFLVGGQQYALPCWRVVRVVPLVPLRGLPHAPRGVTGLLRLEGTQTPVLDLAILMVGQPSVARMSTRIMIVEAPVPDGGTARVGLVAERITDVIEVDEASLSEPGITVPDAPYLGRIFYDETRQATTQLVDVELLVPAELRALLDGPDEDEVKA